MSFIMDYNPNKPGANNGHFMGLPFSIEEARCILMPVPWDVTTSYTAGTSTAHYNILDASYQLDLCDVAHPDLWKKGIHMVAPDEGIVKWNDKWRHEAVKIIEAWEDSQNVEQSDILQDQLKQINQKCYSFNNLVYKNSKKYLDKRKKLVLIGGDHSTPYGYIKALEDYYDGFGILQIDAHCDLREAYEGFIHSHASIMYNVMTDFQTVEKLVQVGVRDWCPEEDERIREANGWIKTYFMHDLYHAQANGRTWADQCDSIVNDLPDLVYISLDIDGLDPAYCPHTGTPVPGGLEYKQVIYLLEEIQRSGRRVIGADLCEVAGEGHEWDGNVGARLAYKLALLLLG